MILDSEVLAFYQWDAAPEGDVKALLEAVRARMNKMAEGWSRAQKDACLHATPETFKVGRGTGRQAGSQPGGGARQAGSYPATHLPTQMKQSVTRT